MRDVLEATAAAPSRHAAIESALRQAIATHGPSLLFDRDALADVLEHDAVAAPHEIDLLLHAQAVEAPQRLLGAHTGEDVQATIAGLAERLAAEGPIATADAQWAVTTWARVLGVAGGDATAPVVDEFVAAPSAGASEAAFVGALGTEPLAAIPPVVDDAVLQHDGLQPPTGRRDARTVSSRGWPSMAIAVVGVSIFALLLWFNLSRPSLDIVEVTSAGPLVADGAPHEVAIAFKSHRATVRGIEVRPVDGGKEGAPERLAVSPSAASDGRVAAGTIAQWSERPRAVTYRYVLIDDAGARSPPMEKTFEFAAAPPRAPVITAVTVPPDVAPGKPFAIAITYEPGSRGIAKVEMRVASSTIPWTSEVVALPWVAPAFGAPDTMRYPFEAGLRPSSTALDFTMIDADGLRSEPRRVVLDVSSPPAPDVRKPSMLAGCTRTSCGRVVATRKIEPSQGLVGFFRRIFVKDDPRESKVYEIVVRRDDGTLQAINDTRAWAAGARVRIVGNRVVLRCLDANRCT